MGGGYAGLVVQGPLAVTIEQRKGNEAVVCYDTATGDELWSTSYPAAFKEMMGGPGPRATPTIADGEVYSLGAQGDLLCLDLKTGKKKWAVNILQDDKNTQWAMSGSPLVFENLLIVNPGAQTDSAVGKRSAPIAGPTARWSGNPEKRVRGIARPCWRPWPANFRC